MQIAELRQRITEKIGLVAAEGDKESVDAVLAYARAVLVAVARHPGDKDVALIDFVVDTRTAALILGLHPEYVRSLVRGDHLEATKEGGEFRIALSHILRFMDMGMKYPRGPFAFSTQFQALLRQSYATTLWRRPEELPEPGESPA